MPRSREAYLNTEETIDRTVGDTRTPFKGQLWQGDAAAVLAADDVVLFHMVAEDGTPKVEGAAAVVTDRPNALVEYDPKAVDVDTLGRFHYYWVAKTPGGATDVFPHDGQKRWVEFHARPEGLT